MARVGFIHDKLDIKFLILYIMSRVAAPIDMPTLADLTMCDEGVDYFDFAEAAAELVSTGTSCWRTSGTPSQRRAGKTGPSVKAASLFCPGQMR